MRTRFGTGKNVLVLSNVSFFNNLSSEMIIPILPMFITALGGTGVAVGIIGGVRDSAANILKVFCGYWSDKSGRRKIFVSSGYSISIVFKILLAFSAAWQHVLIFAGRERISKDLRTAAGDASKGRPTVGAPILLYILFNIFHAAFSIPFGNLSDKIGRKKVITFGFTAFALTCLGFGLFDSLPAFIALFAIYGVVFAVIDGNQRAYISDLASGGLAGTALGAWSGLFTALGKHFKGGDNHEIHRPYRNH